MNLSKDYRTSPLLLVRKLTDAWEDVTRDCNDTKINTVHTVIDEIIDNISGAVPFSCFDSAYSRNAVVKAFTEHEEYIPHFVSVHIYLLSDTVNFSTIALNFSQTVIEADVRTKTEHAKTALMFFTAPEIASLLKEANPIPFTEGITLRPRMSVIPVIPWDGDTKNIDRLQIKRRVYYSRMMDFFISDFFEALSVGHYVRQCKVCGCYFIMTGARKQYYCQTANLEYGVPRANVAKHRKTRKVIGNIEKQKANDNPLYAVYKKRSDSIRKDRSTGKHTAELCDSAQRYARNCYERALIEPVHADSAYATDMLLTNIYEAARKVSVK